VLHIMGDSISLQYRGYLRGHLQKHFRCTREGEETQALKNLDVPSGSNAGDSGSVLTRMKILLGQSRLKPDVVLLNCGLHDIKVDPASGKINVPAQSYRSNLEQIVKCAAAAKVQLIWVRTTHSVDAIHNKKKGPGFQRFAKDGLRYNRVADEVMWANGIPIVDLNSFTRGLGEDAEIFCDHVHFIERVRELQAAFLAGWLLAWRAKG
jgi:hypothetical protein